MGQKIIPNLPGRPMGTQDRLKAQAFYSAFAKLYDDFERQSPAIVQVVEADSTDPESTPTSQEYTNRRVIGAWRDGRSLAIRPGVPKVTKSAYYLFPCGSRVTTSEMVKIAHSSPYRELLENCMYQPTGSGFQRRPKKLLRYNDGKRGEWQPGLRGSNETYVAYARAMLWLADYLEELRATAQVA